LKRARFIFISLTLASLVLTACGFSPEQLAADSQAPAAGATAPAPVYLTIWHAMTGLEADTLAASVSSFETANPGIQVTLQAVPADQLLSQFITAAASGGGPDLLFGPLDWIGPLANANLISSLDSQTTQIGLDRLYQTAVAAVTFKGRVFAVPTSSTLVGLWYNTDLIKTPPTDSDELLADAQKVGLALNSSFSPAAGFILGEGGQIFDGNQKAILDQGNGTAQALSWLLKASQTQNVHIDTNQASLDALFKAGKVGMIFNGDWAASDYTAALGASKLAVAPPITLLPGGKPFAPFLGTRNIYLSMSSKGATRSAALNFLAFCSQPDTQALFVKVGYIPTSSKVQTTDPIILGFMKQGQVASYLPNEAEMGAVWAPAGNMISQVLSAAAAPDAAVAAAVQAINAANHK
jgi:maltose-binding protein MalE